MFAIWWAVKHTFPLTSCPSGWPPARVGCCNNVDTLRVRKSVPDSWHFGMDPNHWPLKHQQKPIFFVLKFFCWSGSVPLTNGSRSGSKRSKNIRIRRSGSATLVGTQKSYVLAVCLMILVKMFIIRKENDLVCIGWLSYARKAFNTALQLHTLLTCF